MSLYNEIGLPTILFYLSSKANLGIFFLLLTSKLCVSNPILLLLSYLYSGYLLKCDFDMKGNNELFNES